MQRDIGWQYWYIWRHEANIGSIILYFGSWIAIQMVLFKSQEGTNLGDGCKAGGRRMPEQRPPWMRRRQRQGIFSSLSWSVPSGATFVLWLAMRLVSSIRNYSQTVQWNLKSFNFIECTTMQTLYNFLHPRLAKVRTIGLLCRQFT